MNEPAFLISDTRLLALLPRATTEQIADTLPLTLAVAPITCKVLDDWSWLWEGFEVIKPPMLEPSSLLGFENLAMSAFTAIWFDGVEMIHRQVQYK